MEKERRKFKRFDSYVSFRFVVSGKEVERGMGLSMDLSRGGIKIACNHSARKGSKVDFQIDIPDDPKPVIGAGEVVWVKKAKSANADVKGRDYDLGIRFLSIDPVDKFRILDYAYNSWLEDQVTEYEEDESLATIG